MRRTASLVRKLSEPTSGFLVLAVGLWGFPLLLQSSKEVKHSETMWDIVLKSLLKKLYVCFTENECSLLRSNMTDFPMTEVGTSTETSDMRTKAHGSTTS